MIAQSQLMGEPVSEEEEIYKENIIDHYQHPRRKGALQGATHVHQEFNPLCGDRVTVYLNIQEGRVQNASFEGDGCAISQASASLLVDHLVGKSAEEAQQLAPWDIYNLLGIRISHARAKCALLPLKALQEGLKEKQVGHNNTAKNNGEQR